MRCVALVSVLAFAACSSSSGGGGDLGGDDDQVTDVDPVTDDEPTTDDDEPVVQPLIPAVPETCVPSVTAVDVSTPDHVVGTGTPASCSASALESAIAAGGIITFDCGSERTTIHLTSPVTLPLADVTIDGSGRITIDGGDTTRLFVRDTYTATPHTITFQHIALTHGRSTSTTSNAGGCATSHDIDAGGGAIYFANTSPTPGRLQLIDVLFANNQAPLTGPDVGGGAVYVRGPALYIAGSTFDANSGANGGAVGTLGGGVTVFNSVFENNVAAGAGACGGNGGAISTDGPSFNALYCGVIVQQNQANSTGGGVFRVGYNQNDTTTFELSTIADNASPVAGGIYLQEHTVVVRNSTISGNTGGGGARLINAPIAIVNTTFAGNTSTTTGAGLAVDGDSAGSIVNCTFAANTGRFAALTAPATLAISNTLFADNVATAAFNNISCSATLSGGFVMQWPEFTHDADGNPAPGTPETKCATSVTFANPQLAALADNGGPTKTILPANTAVRSVGDASTCPDFDQRGQPRQKPCTLGAVELP